MVCKNLHRFVGGEVINPAEIVGRNFHGALQHDFDHRMRAQCAVQLIKLFAAGGGHGNGHAEIFAAFALAQFDGTGVKRRVELVRDHRDGVDQAFHFESHDFDGKLRGVLNEGLGGRADGVDWD